MANLWARKSTAALAEEAAQGDDGDAHAPKRTLSALNLVGLGDRRHHRRRHFCPDRACRRGQCRARGHAVLYARRGGLRVRRACYAELSSTIPISGSAYTYAYATMGELIAWIIGWDLILEYAVAAGRGRGRLVRLCRQRRA